MRRRMLLVLATAVAGVAVVVSTAQAVQFSPWGDAVKIDTVAGNHPDLNTTALDGCPIESPDGRDLYMASNRPGGEGLLDIWVAHRDDPDEPYGAPENLGPAINSAADDFCPTPVRGGGLFFVSRRAGAGACGLGDIFFTRRNPAHGWSEPRRLACAPAGPNSALDEQGPSYVGAQLYFSRSAPGVQGDIFVSPRVGDREFGPAEPAVGLNSPTANDIQPNVRKDGHEVVFSSNRGSGGQDIYAATREGVDDAWSEPVNLGPAINTGAAETRPSFSWHADRLLFGRAPGPEGMSDIYLATRDR
jgi:WD40-like Beta Propeller Repeat